MGKAEREKGKRGEREAAKMLGAIIGLQVRRSSQYRATESSADLICPGLWIEVKRRERLGMSEVEKALKEAPSGPAVLMWRRNGKEWIVACRLLELPILARRIMEAMKEQLDEEQAGKSDQESEEDDPNELP